MPSCAGSGISHTLMQVFLYFEDNLPMPLVHLHPQNLWKYFSIWLLVWWNHNIKCILISLVFFNFYYRSIEEDEEQLHFDALLRSSTDLYLVGIRQQTSSDELQHLRTSNNLPKELLPPTVRKTPDYLTEKWGCHNLIR